MPEPIAMPMMDMMQPEQYAAPVQPEKYGKNKSRLLDYAEMDNIASVLDEEQLKKIGQKVVEEFEIDDKSREDWSKRNADALKLANQVKEAKSFPWPNSANVKLPLISDASIKFAARAYAEIIRDGSVVKGKVIGKDPDNQKALRSDRVGRYMSWQLTDQMKEWETDTDKLLHILAVSGVIFRKMYYDPGVKRTCSQLVLADKLCVNYTASSLEAARRITHILDAMPKNTVVSNQRSGVWLDVNLQKDPVEKEPEQEELFNFLEQHRYIDLDEDGYAEPYIVTVHRETGKVVRIYARYEEKDIKENAKKQIVSITPCQYFADYHFIPSFDGGFYSIGFGTLMAPLNETANGLFNMLLDSGTINNVQGGFLSKEIKVKGGIYRFAPYEWKKTEATAEQLKNGIAPLPTKEPSPTLFNLLSLVMELCKDLASIKDVMAGDAPGANVPATTVMALIEQGMKVYNAIYKRVYRALKQEFGILFRLNYRYLDEEEYFRVQDTEAMAFRADFESESVDVIPVADPYMSSDVQRLTKAEALKQNIGLPGVNPRPIIEFGLQAMRIDQEMIAEILPEQDPNTDPEMIKMLHEAEIKKAELENEERSLTIQEGELALKQAAAPHDMALTDAQTQKTLAEAQAIGARVSIDATKTLIDSSHREMDREDARDQAEMAKQESQTNPQG